MEERIKEIILSLGADVCGIANIDRFGDSPKGFSPTDSYKNTKSVIVFGCALPKGLTKVDSRFIYGYFNNLSCSVVDRIAFLGAKQIEKEFNAEAVPMPCDSPYEYWNSESKTGKGLISMKHAAVKAGIGSLGKNTLLINKEYGNLLTIGAVFCNLSLKSDGLCGDICVKNCRKCLDACPVHAIKDGRVDQSLCRPNAYGKSSRGFDTVLCNKCRMVCPNRYGI